MPLVKSRYAFPSASHSVTPSPRTSSIGARLYVPNSASADPAAVVGETRVAMGETRVAVWNGAVRISRGDAEDFLGCVNGPQRPQRAAEDCLFVLNHRGHGGHGGE